ncbi:MAG: FprA family A-type flavoprotein [Phycisphaerae bacterium]|nr:FprA family A-type flavoprotein [Phycisphaerae bacterium]
MRQLKPDVYEVGALDWDRRLFDELIPLPDGTTYNAYVVKGSEKTVLLDTVDPSKTETLIGNLVTLGIDRIDYLVAHHGEQDHSGAIPDILTLYPGAKVVVNAKCKDLLATHLHIEEDRFLVIQDGQTLSLGNKTLRFLDLPWVHWPETFGTYLQEDGVLFSCDFFGSHLASSSLFVEDWAKVHESAKRYYAEIMMPFRGPIRKNLEKLAPLRIEIIAPSHGPVYDRPKQILEVYQDWASDQVKNEVVLPFVSMHHSTRRMVDHLIAALMERGIGVRPFNLSGVDIGELAMALVDAATLVLGCPTVLVGPHPLAAYAAFLANALRPKTRFASLIGSYGWASKAVEQLTAMIPNLKVELIEPVVVKGLPRDQDYLALDSLADRILAKHQQAGILES